jgi:hypothetical protein
MLYLFQENKSYGVKHICIHPLMYVTVRHKSRRAHQLSKVPYIILKHISYGYKTANRVKISNF